MAESRSMGVNTISAHLLNSERHHREVYSLMKSLKVQWVELGMNLGVPYDPELQAINEEKPTLDQKLMEMLSVWLRRRRKDQPIPSWRILHDAVQPLDGNIAEAIAKDHSCNCDDCLGIKQPDKYTSSVGSTSMDSKPPPAAPTPSSTFDQETVFQYLKNKSSKWEAIGCSFKVPLNTRENLRRNIQLDSEGRLEQVIDSWFTTTGSASDLTWEGFLSLLKNKMGFNDVARKVEADLKLSGM